MSNQATFPINDTTSLVAREYFGTPEIVLYGPGDRALAKVAKASGRDAWQLSIEGSYSPASFRRLLDILGPACDILNQGGSAKEAADHAHKLATGLVKPAAAERGTSWWRQPLLGGGR